MLLQERPKSKSKESSIIYFRPQYNTDRFERGIILDNHVQHAVDKLVVDFPNLRWNFQESAHDGKKELISQWLCDQDKVTLGVEHLQY